MRLSVLIAAVAASLSVTGCLTENVATPETPDAAATPVDATVGGGEGGGGAGGEAGGAGGGGGGGGAPPLDAGLPADAAPIPEDAEPIPEDAAPIPEDAEPPVDAAPPPVDAEAPPETRFSFFVTSLAAMRALSGSPDGFGGDFGGIAGADEICQTIAEGVGAGHKTWRAFLSAADDGTGQAAHAIDRVGPGPWYDANDRLIAQNIAGLLGDRPAGNPQAINDLCDEHGVPISQLGDAHDVVTGSNRQGRLSNPDPAFTCDSWTSTETRVAGAGRGQGIMCGHSFPRSNRSGLQWISDHPLRGCAPGVNLIQNGPGVGDCIGCSGGYGALYCMAVAP